MEADRARPRGPSRAEADRGRPRGAQRLVALVAVLAFGVVAVRSAWLCDDAYITLRTVDNWLGGYGATWNPDERVQAYTHPLWMALLAAVCGATGDRYVAPIALGLVLSLASVAVVVLAARSVAAAVACGLALLLSKAFVDYSTSGLEDPLVHLLLAAFAAQGLRRRPPATGMAWLAGLGALARPDALLLFAPPLGRALRGLAPRRALRPLLAALAPLAAWVAFSLLYYGAPWPNTAYAKLGAGIPLGDRLAQGMHYLANSLREDPVTLPVLAAGLLAARLPGRPGRGALAAGALSFVGYAVAIGGDFMSGRLLTAPLVAAVAILGATELPGGRTAWTGVAAAVLALGLLLAPAPTVWNGPSYSQRREISGRPQVDAYGIADERAFFFPYTGLFRSDPERGPASHAWARAAIEARRAGVGVVVAGAVGLAGFHAGPDVRVVDRFALGDPFLSRLPARADMSHRVGHFERIVPEGYVRSRMRGTNEIVDPGLARCYDDVRRATRGPLLERARLVAVGRLLLHGCPGSDAARWPRETRDPAPPVAIAWEALAHLAADRAIGAEQGVDVYCDGAMHARRLALRVAPAVGYRVSFHRGDERLGSAPVAPPGSPAGALVEIEVPVPAAVAERGFDRLRIVPRGAPSGARLGAIRVAAPAG